jgi:hypothetical protein
MTRAQWLIGTPVILPTWEVEIRKIKFKANPGNKVFEPLSQPAAGHGGMHLSFQ